MNESSSLQCSAGVSGWGVNVQRSVSRRAAGTAMKRMVWLLDKEIKLMVGWRIVELK